MQTFEKEEHHRPVRTKMDKEERGNGQSLGSISQRTNERMGVPLKRQSCDSNQSLIPSKAQVFVFFVQIMLNCPKQYSQVTETFPGPPKS